MNLLEAMLKADEGKVTQKDTKDYEVKRLSESFGVPFILHLQEILPKRMSEIQGLSFDFDKKGRFRKGDTHEVNLLYLCDGIANPEFKDKELLKKYHAASPKDLYEKLFKTGEISYIAWEIQELSGYDDGEDEKDTGKN